MLDEIPCEIRLSMLGNAAHAATSKAIDTIRNDLRMVDLSRLEDLKVRASNAIKSKRGTPSKRRSVKNNATGPGTILSRKFAEWGVTGCAKCKSTVKKMDNWGPAKCRENRDELAAEILPRAKALLAGMTDADDRAITAAILEEIDSAIAESERLQKKSVDVLLIVSTNGNQWKEEQTGFLDLLSESGITAQATSIHVVSDLPQTLAETRPAVCIIRAMPMTADELRPIADAWPETRFLVCCHSQPSHLTVWKGGVEKFTGYINLANELDNVWLATPDEREPWGKITKSIWIPNTVSPIEPGKPGIVGPVDLSLVGRRDSVKNVPNQIVAAGIANQTRTMRLHLIVNGEHQDFAALAEACGLTVYTHGWLQHDAHRKRIANLIDIGLQAGFCESFNYVALEHLLCGKPVVGSKTVRFLPESFQVDPNDVYEIAELILAFADDIDRDETGTLETCRDIGVRVAEHVNGALISTLKGLL